MTITTAKCATRNAQMTITTPMCSILRRMSDHRDTQVLDPPMHE
ncbi:MAG: hypothetical protein U0175_28005 [Caldilineaceae bacterium]